MFCRPEETVLAGGEKGGDKCALPEEGAPNRPFYKRGGGKGRLPRKEVPNPSSSAKKKGGKGSFAARRAAGSAEGGG